MSTESEPDTAQRAGDADADADDSTSVHIITPKERLGMKQVNRPAKKGNVDVGPETGITEDAGSKHTVATTSDIGPETEQIEEIEIEPIVSSTSDISSETKKGENNDRTSSASATSKLAVETKKMEGDENSSAVNASSNVNANAASAAVTDAASNVAVDTKNDDSTKTKPKVSPNSIAQRLERNRILKNLKDIGSRKPTELNKKELKVIRFYVRNINER